MKNQNAPIISSDMAVQNKITLSDCSVLKYNIIQSSYEMYCVKGGFTIQIHIGWWFICGKMTQAGGVGIDQQKGTEAGVSGDDLGAPFSL